MNATTICCEGRSDRSGPDETRKRGACPRSDFDGTKNRDGRGSVERAVAAARTVAARLSGRLHDF